MLVTTFRPQVMTTSSLEKMQATAIPPVMTMFISDATQEEPATAQTVYLSEQKQENSILPVLIILLLVIKQDKITSMETITLLSAKIPATGTLLLPTIPLWEALHCALAQPATEIQQSETKHFMM